MRSTDAGEAATDDTRPATVTAPRIVAPFAVMLAHNVLTQIANSPAAFRDVVKIDRDGELVCLSSVLDPWQRSDFESTDAGWRRCVGLPVSGEVKLRAFRERPRGHSKTSDLAVMVSWALSFATRMTKGYAAAADKDQARLLRDAIALLIRTNPWLSEVLEVQNYTIKNIATGHPGAGSFLEILSSDVGSSYGLLPDFIICDELTHWQGEGDLWHSLISSAAKRSTCMVVVISNAGTGAGSSWQWKVREFARSSEGWHFSRIDGPQASWLSPAILEEQRLLLPPKVYRRLWLNEWVTGGDALDLNDIEAAVLHGAGMVGKEPGWRFCAGLDLGVKSDHSALVVLGANSAEQRVRLARCESWRPIGGQVDLDAVSAGVLTAHRQFGLKRVLYDPHQCALMAQQLARAGVPMVEMPFVGGNLHQMASTLVESFRSKRLELYRDESLVTDLTQLCIAERSYGLKLEAKRSSNGHADRAIAMSICLPYAMEMLTNNPPDLGAWLAAGAF